MLLQHWRSLAGPRMLKYGLEHLPPMSAMLHYTTSIEANQADDCVLPPYPRHLKKLPSWLEIPSKSVNSVDLEMIGADAAAFKELSDVKRLRRIFEKKIRPYLAARCLLSDYPMGGSKLKQIHFMHQAIIGKFPQYITSISLMKLLATRSETQHKPILESLVNEGVVVLVDWVEEPTTLDILFYDHGLLLASESGRPSDSVIYKAECDACKCRWEPREMIGHVNNMAIAAHFSDLWSVTDALADTSNLFWGMPFARVNQNRNRTIKSLGEAIVDRRIIQCANCYFISLSQDGQKADAFEGLIDVLDPSCTIILVNSTTSASNVLRKLTPTHACTIWEGGFQTGRVGDLSSKSCKAHVLFNQTVVPYSNEKTLVVFYDSLAHPIQYEERQDLKQIIEVHLIGQQDAKPLSAQEVDPFLSGFFSYPGASGVVLKQKDINDGSNNES